MAADNELVLSRLLNAPRTLVFDTFTEPLHGWMQPADRSRPQKMGRGNPFSAKTKAKQPPKKWQMISVPCW